MHRLFVALVLLLQASTILAIEQSFMQYDFSTSRFIAIKAADLPESVGAAFSEHQHDRNFEASIDGGDPSW